MTLVEAAQFAQAASTGFASLLAIYGIDAWRREHRWKRNSELAEEVLANFYQAKDAIAQMRSPFSWGGEGETRKGASSEDARQKAARDAAYVLIERYNKHSELFAALGALRYRFMATFSADKAKPFDDLARLVNELVLASHTKARLDTTPEWGVRDEAAMFRHQAERERIDRIFYAGMVDSDPIADRVSAIVLEVEQTCRAVIDAKGSLYRLINWSRR